MIVGLWKAQYYWKAIYVLQVLQVMLAWTPKLMLRGQHNYISDKKEWISHEMYE